MVGRVDFDLSQVTYMNSLGVRAWCFFLKEAPIQGYEFHACSVPFVLQASMVRDVIGRGTVTSFFAPFHCIGCDHQEERLLQSAPRCSPRGSSRRCFSLSVQVRRRAQRSTTLPERYSRVPRPLDAAAVAVDRARGVAGVPRATVTTRPAQLQPMRSL